MGVTPAVHRRAIIDGSWPRLASGADEAEA
jgi:hypothetical protein